VTRSGSSGLWVGAQQWQRRIGRAVAAAPHRVLVVPSGGTVRGSTRRVRMLALLAARDEMEQLPAWLRNIAPHVDGIVALDDGSRDGTGDWLSSQPEVLEVVRNPVGRPAWDEIANHRALVEAAGRHDADWVVCVDADERVERNFRSRAERVIARGRLLGLSAYHVRLRELWDRADHYRVDGLWGRKSVARLFRLRTDHEFDERPLHSQKTPRQGRIGPYLPLADLELYHLAMLTPERREARRRKYELADPDARWQPDLGYAYLTDERGVRLRRVPATRSYAE
jgi:Glycosyl transferase family 2